MESLVGRILESRVAGICESIHSKCRPVLRKIEVDSFFGVCSLHVGSIIIGVIQLIMAPYIMINVSIPLGIFYLMVSFLLLISVLLKQRLLTVPWLLLMVFCELFLIGLMISELCEKEYVKFIENLFSFLFYLIGFSVIYSFFMKMNDLPAVNSVV